MELEGTCLTPEAVLKASGHVDRFSDLLVNDTVTGKGYRADHLLEVRLCVGEGRFEMIERKRGRLLLFSKLDHVRPVM